MHSLPIEPYDKLKQVQTYSILIYNLLLTRIRHHVIMKTTPKLWILTYFCSKSDYLLVSTNTINSFFIFVKLLFHNNIHYNLLNIPYGCYLHVQVAKYRKSYFGVKFPHPLLIHILAQNSRFLLSWLVCLYNLMIY